MRLHIYLLLEKLDPTFLLPPFDTWLEKWLKLHIENISRTTFFLTREVGQVAHWKHFNNHLVPSMASTWTSNEKFIWETHWEKKMLVEKKIWTKHFLVLHFFYNSVEPSVEFNLIFMFGIYHYPLSLVEVLISWGEVHSKRVLFFGDKDVWLACSRAKVCFY